MKKPREPVQLDILIQIDVKALQKIWLWSDMSVGEFSALGEVEITDSALLITDLHLVKQICNDCETEMDPEALAELMTEIDPSKLRCWMHSHCGMPVFWSSTDNECIEGLANGEWLLSLVVNRKHETMMRLDQFHPSHMYLTDVVWEVYYPLDEELKKACAEEFKQKVRQVPSSYLGNRLLPVDPRMGLTEEEIEWMEDYA